jgi:virginiamycin B lyase
MTEPAQFTEHRISNETAAPYGVAVTDDGAVWVTLIRGSAVVRRDPDGSFATISLGEGSEPALPAVATEDSIWVTDSALNRVVRVGPEGIRGVTAVPSSGARPFGIASSDSGEVWFTEMTTDSIGRIDILGRVAEFAAGVEHGTPSMIASSGESVWFTLNAADGVGYIRGGNSAVALTQLPTHGAGPVGITVATDAAAWFTEIAAGQIGRIDRNGELTEYPLPDRGSKPHAIAANPEGGCWFTLWGSNQLGYIAADGTIALTDLPTPDSEPHGLAVGQDGTVWIALETGFLAELRP